MSQKQEILIKLDEKTVQKFAGLKKNLNELRETLNTKFSQTLEKLTQGVERLNTALGSLRNVGTGSTTPVRQTDNVSRTLPSRGSYGKTTIDFIPPKQSKVPGFGSDAIATAAGVKSGVLSGGQTQNVVTGQTLNVGRGQTQNVGRGKTQKVGRGVTQNVGQKIVRVHIKNVDTGQTQNVSKNVTGGKTTTLVGPGRHLKYPLESALGQVKEIQNLTRNEEGIFGRRKVSKIRHLAEKIENRLSGVSSRISASQETLGKDGFMHFATTGATQRIKAAQKKFGAGGYILESYTPGSKDIRSGLPFLSSPDLRVPGGSTLRPKNIESGTKRLRSGLPFLSSSDLRVPGGSTIYRRKQERKIFGLQYDEAKDLDARKKFLRDKSLLTAEMVDVTKNIQWPYGPSSHQDLKTYSNLEQQRTALQKAEGKRYRRAVRARETYELSNLKAKRNVIARNNVAVPPLFDPLTRWGLSTLLGGPNPELQKIDAEVKEARIRRAKSRGGRLRYNLHRAGIEAQHFFTGGRAGSIVRGAFPWAVGAYKAIQLGASAIREHNIYESAERQLSTLYGENAGTGVFGDVRNIALQTPLTFQNTVRATSKLAAYGVKSRHVGNTILKLGDLARGNPQALETAATVFGRANKLGYLQGMERNMLVDATGFDPLSTYAQMKGLDTSEVFDMMRKREFTIDKFNEALTFATSRLGPFGGMLEKMSETGKGQLQILESQWSAIKDTIGGGLATVVNPVLKFLNETLKGWTAQKSGVDLDKLDLSGIRVKDQGKNRAMFRKDLFTSLGSENWVDLMSKPGVRKYILSNPRLKADLETILTLTSGEYRDILGEGFVKTKKIKARDFWRMVSRSGVEDGSDDSSPISRRLKQEADTNSPEIQKMRAEAQRLKFSTPQGAENPDYKNMMARIAKKVEDVKMQRNAPVTHAVNHLLYFLAGTFATREDIVEKLPAIDLDADKKKVTSGGTRPRVININVDEMIGIKAEKWAQDLDKSSAEVLGQITGLFNQVLRNVTTMA